MSGSARCEACGQPVSWVTASRAAQVLNVTEGRVRKLIADGRLPGSTKSQDWKPGRGVWMIPIASLEALLAARAADRRSR